MILSKNKRGMDVHYYFMILAVIIAIISYSVSYLQDKREIGNYIGEYQFSIIRSATEGDNSLIYIQQEASYALDESIYELAESGGSPLDIEQECGNFVGANVWFEIRRTDSGFEEINCFDEEKISNNLLHVFNNRLNVDLSNNPFGLETDNYEYRIKGNIEVYGFAKRPLNMDIIYKK